MLWFNCKKKKMDKIIDPVIGKTLLLAFDHGFEHGPAKYEGVDMSPERIARVALEGCADGVIVHVGAAKRIREIIPKGMALIVKLTGRTTLAENEIQSTVTTVEEAKKLGADGVAVTLYVGSPHEYLMLQNISKIKADCRKHKMPLIGFVYPRVKGRHKHDPEAIRYAARVGAEMGFDLVKTYYTGSKETFSKAVDDCYVPLACAGGEVKGEGEFLTRAQEIMETGVKGMIVGRNIWTHQHPGLILGKLRTIVHKRYNHETVNHR